MQRHLLCSASVPDHSALHVQDVLDMPHRGREKTGVVARLLVALCEGGCKNIEKRAESPGFRLAQCRAEGVFVGVGEIHQLRRTDGFGPVGLGEQARRAGSQPGRRVADVVQDIGDDLDFSLLLRPFLQRFPLAPLCEHGFRDIEKAGLQGAFIQAQQVHAEPLRGTRAIRPYFDSAPLAKRDSGHGGRTGQHFEPVVIGIKNFPEIINPPAAERHQETRSRRVEQADVPLRRDRGQANGNLV